MLTPGDLISIDSLVFHPSASMMAFLTRQEKDFVVVYSTLTYQELFVSLVGLCIGVFIVLRWKVED